MRRLRGSTLIEAMVALLLLMLLGLGAFQFFVSSNLARDSMMYGNTAITDGRQPIDIVSDHLRNAQQYTSDNITYVAISAATATSVTYYTDASGSTVQYLLSGSNLQRVDSTGTTTVLPNVSSLQFTYYLAPSASSYYTDTLTVGDPTGFGVPERARIAEIKITGAVTANGYSRSFSTTVRLRNSPRKVRL